MFQDINLAEVVNLSSYSQSRNFFGFYEAINRNDINSWIIADDFYCAFTGKTSNLEVASSLFIDVNLASVAAEFDSDIEQLTERIGRFKEDGVVRLVDYDTVFAGVDWSTSEFDQAFERVERDLRMIDRPTRKFVEESVNAAISVDGVCGHLFLLLPDFNLVAYPHDDMGFGFIFLNEATRAQQEMVQARLRSPNLKKYKIVFK